MRFAVCACALGLFACGGGDDQTPRPLAANASASASSGGSGGGGSGGGADSGGGAVCPTGTAFSTFSGKIVVEVELDGAGPYKMLLDTGAPESGIDPALAKATTRQVTIAGKSRTLKLPGDFPPMYGIRGIIGTDFMGAFAASIDYQRKVLWFDDQRDEEALLACDHVERTPAIVAFERVPYLMVDGILEGKTGRFLLDTGATLGLVPDPVFDALNQAAPRPALDGFYTMAAIGVFWSRLASLGTMEIGGKHVDHLTTRTAPQSEFSILTPPDVATLGLVPSGFLHHFLVTIDYTTDTLRLDGYQRDSFREPSYRYVSGIGLEPTLTPPIHITEVLEGSSASEAGIAVGDVLSAIHGTAIDAIAPKDRAWDLASSGPSTVAVTVLKQSSTVDCVLDNRDLLDSP